jgi:hypothetical protein
MLHSSPVKSGGQVYAPQLRADIQSFAVPDEFEDLSLADFWKVLDYRPEDFKDYHLSDHWHPKDDFGEYMNEISKSVFDGLGAYLLKSLVV